jgi:archaellum component FlaG (FlaF/FlaG flagellin family)
MTPLCIFARTVSLAVLVVFVLAGASVLAQPGNPVPFIDQPLVPGAVAPGAPGATLTVNGAGFVVTSVVKWNGNPLATTYVSAAQLLATVPAAKLVHGRTVSITVSSPGPGGGSSNAVLFTVTNATPSLAFQVLPVAGVKNAIAVVAADFNHDGKTDLAYVSPAPAPSCNYQYYGVGSIVILLGNGDGTFRQKSIACFPDYLGIVPEQFLMVADYNGDGNPDLITESFEFDYERVAVNHGVGNGTFSAPIEAVEGVTKQRGIRRGSLAADEPFQAISGLATGDFDGKGQVGMAVSGVYGNGASYVVLIPDYNYLEFSESGSSGPLGAGDFNGDGILDLAAFWEECNSDCPPFRPLQLFLNNGGGTFAQAPQSAFEYSSSPMAIADFNGDGILDVAQTNANAFIVYLGNGDGTFTAKAGQPITAQDNVFLSTADFNGDGIPDLAVVDSTNAVSIYLGNGDGTFQSGISTTGLADTTLAVGDFNGDGRLDLAAVNSADGTVSLILQAAVGGVSPSALPFPNQKVGTTSRPLQVLLTNTGSAPMSFGSAQITVPASVGSTQISGDFHMKTNQCKQVLQPGKSGKVTITFTPTATGQRRGTLTFIDSGTNSPQVVNLSGVGTP